MLKFTVPGLALAAGLLAFSSTPSQAYDCYMLCWGLKAGGTQCTCLPDNFRISGVERPWCDANGCTQTSFRLTPSVIGRLSRYVDTSTMAPRHWATIYAKGR